MTPRQTPASAGLLSAERRGRAAANEGQGVGAIGANGVNGANGASGPVGAVGRLLRSHRPGEEPLRVLSASGQLGYGIVGASLERGLARQPHFIGCDMGSIDPGPYYLGSGEMAPPEDMVRRDLALVLGAARRLNIPLLIGSAGTAGARPHLEATLELVREVAQAQGLRMRLALIESDVDPGILTRALAEGRLHPLDDGDGPLPFPSAADIEACTHRVAQCGTETFIRALTPEVDVVLAGRACDTAIFAALPEMLGYDPGLALHMAKIVECTSLCCDPGGRDAILAELWPDHFVLESMNPALRATPASVAAHALYEQADPWFVEEPGGTLDLRSARYEAEGERRTRVAGARFTPRPQPTLKIEGACHVGARAVLLAGIADPVMQQELPRALEQVEAKVRSLVALAPGQRWALHPHAYGQGAITPRPPGGAGGTGAPCELGLVLEFIASDMALARTVAAVLKQNRRQHGYPGRLSTAGNLAFPFTPSELVAGEAYGFCLYHRLDGEDPAHIFRLRIENIGLAPVPVPANREARP